MVGGGHVLLSFTCYRIVNWNKYEENRARTYGSYMYTNNYLKYIIVVFRLGKTIKIFFVYTCVI